MNKAKLGDDVLFTPSADAKRKKLQGAKDSQKTFAAKVIDVNADSLDLMVFSKECVPFAKIPHKMDTETGHSHWQHKE